MKWKGRELRWDCRDQKDQEGLEEWTNEQLDAADKDDPLRLLLHKQPHDTYRKIKMLASRSENYATREQSELRRNLIKSVRKAIQAQDFQALADMAPLLRRLGAKRDPRGREKGERRPDDLPESVREALPHASADVGRIRDIWFHRFGKRNRGADPTAIQIAARRWGIDPSYLEGYKKRSRKKRSS